MWFWDSESSCAEIATGCYSELYIDHATALITLYIHQESK